MPPVDNAELLLTLNTRYGSAIGLGERRYFATTNPESTGPHWLPNYVGYFQTTSDILTAYLVNTAVATTEASAKGVVYEAYNLRNNVTKAHRAKIKALRSLQANWDGYGASAPSEYAAFWSEVILDILEEFPLTPFRIAASAEGGIGITFKSGARIGALETLNSQTIIAVTTDRTSEPEVWAVAGRHGIRKALNKITTYLG